MDAQDELPTAAQHAVEQAMLAMLVPRATAADLLRLSPLPSYICMALRRLAALAGALLHDQHHAPHRAELAARLAPLQEYIERLPPIISGKLDRRLALRPLLAELARGGGFTLSYLFGDPSAKLVVACGVTVLHLAYSNEPLGERNPRARALCATLLAWAAEQTGVPLPKASDASRRTQWGHPLRQARASVMTADPDPCGGALSIAWWAVQTALQPIADHASFNPAAGCKSGSI
jgi:hypothetical protein